MNPRVLFVARTRYRLPLEGLVAEKWDELSHVLDVRVLATAHGEPQDDGRFHLLASTSGAVFWSELPFRVAAELRAFRPDAVVVQSPYEAAAVLAARRLARSRALVVTDVHGDWRTATRLYGSGLRRVLSPAADAVASLALRRSDAIRTVSPYTTRLVRAIGREPARSFPAGIDLDAFTASPPVEPAEPPTALFVGVLERYKDVDGLADAWRIVAGRAAEARLHVVGEGSRADAVRTLVRDCGESVRWTPRLDAAGVARALDEATALVLPSRSEGMGRVVIEAFCRARPVVGTRVGGIPDLVDDGVNGMLVAPRDPGALADALSTVLTDRELARRLGRAAYEASFPWRQTPAEFAAKTRELVDSLVR